MGLVKKPREEQTSGPVMGKGDAEDWGGLALETKIEG